MHRAPARAQLDAPAVDMPQHVVQALEKTQFGSKQDFQDHHNKPFCWYCLPQWEVVGQLVPLTAGFVDIQDALTMDCCECLRLPNFQLPYRDGHPIQSA